MSWRRRQRVERAVAQALRPGARPPVEMLCELAGGCAPDGELITRAHPRLAIVWSMTGARSATFGVCARCGGVVAHDCERLLRGE